MDVHSPAKAESPSKHDPRAANRDRFELELEFVQSLANPYYLHSLAQQNILDQPAFVNYLSYLQYWRHKDYARFIHYPHALHHLELLQQATFRAEIKKDEWREYLNQKQFDHWRTWFAFGSAFHAEIFTHGFQAQPIEANHGGRQQYQRR
ncbi:SOH1-domain-containing protein [Coniophora puteana RWD-64-598 SS2]|uniref:Mediator of RNA polymerase II transcription subunit 31 n=1 Tax=Coniophora puteana (strain RWD-64-598) TaxID=741705 RepID=A0A5M3MTZ5_CONPW|nr:SOH1-domain-containing protein [Coniophora puteana RWD-64-598 SS2]EIW82633.1 SOH1-domain-containing protein [Coniophora puteana RWD-64-598 SS2]